MLPRSLHDRHYDDDNNDSNGDSNNYSHLEIKSVDVDCEQCEESIPSYPSTFELRDK